MNEMFSNSKSSMCYMMLYFFRTLVSGQGAIGGGELASQAKAAPRAWPCCDSCDGCTRSEPPRCQCLDAAPRGCHPACRDCDPASAPTRRCSSAWTASPASASAAAPPPPSRTNRPRWAVEPADGWFLIAAWYY
jgi:hypothetical protein